MGRPCSKRPAGSADGQSEPKSAPKSNSGGSKWHCFSCRFADNLSHWRWCNKCGDHWTTKAGSPKEATPAPSVPAPSKWDNGPPASLAGTKRPANGKGKAKEAQPDPTQTTKKEPTDGTADDPLVQMRALKQMLEAASGHLTKTAGLDDADTFSVLLNAFAAKVGNKIKVAEPPPAVPEPHVRSLALMRKINDQTKKVQKFKKQLQEARAKESEAKQHYDGAEDRLGKLRAEFATLTVHLPAIPSPILSDAESEGDGGSDEDMCTDSDLDGSAHTPREMSAAKRRRDRARLQDTQIADPNAVMNVSQLSSFS